ncbi:MAG: asparagine synthetase B family protein [Pseudomonadota bacterium]
MSAIGAIVWSDHAGAVRDPASLDAAARLLGALKIYGPERQSSWCKQPCELVSTLALGFTPEDAFEHQPVSFARRWKVVFAGWISNRTDVCRRLGIEAHAKKTMPDSMLFTSAWHAWERGAVGKLDGSFACFIWDELNRIGFAVRSIGSSPPLYYHQSSSRIVVATAPKGIFALGDIERRTDLLKLQQNLLLDFEDRQRSYYEGVKRIPTGHLIEIKSGEISLHSLYNPRNAISVRFRKDSDYVEAAREHLEHAVAEHSRARQIPALALSSGLDSSAVAMTMLHQHAPKNVLSFTSVPEPGWDGRAIGDGRVGDERGPVEALAKAYPTLETNLIDCAGMDVTEYLDEFFLLAELPPRNVMNMGWITAIAKAARARGKRVLLTGESGNATLGFERYPSISALLMERRIYEFTRRARRYFRHGSAPSLPMIPRDWSAARKPFSPNLADPESENAPADIAQDTLFGGTRDEAGAVQLAIQTLTGVQLRDPLGDRALAEFCMGIPAAQFDKGGEARSLMKRVMNRRLPKEVLSAPRGRQAADTHLRLTRRKEALSQEIEACKSHSMISELIDLKRLQRLLATWPANTPLSRADHPDYLMVHLGLPRAIANLRFAKWVDGSNR